MSRSSAPATPATASSQPAQPAAPAVQFRHRVMAMARSLLTDWVGEQRAMEATGRIASALAAAAASARDPADIYACTPQSIAAAIATAALTGILPGTGSAALAYLVPQRPRAGEPPQLQLLISHRGLNALARRCGQTMIALPIGERDRLRTAASGEVEVEYRDIDHPPTTLEQLRGVIVVVKEIASGAVLCSGWVPRSLIEARKQISRSATSQYSPWVQWPIEMAMKTAMHYAISRGWCVIDDTTTARALSEEIASDVRIAGAERIELTGATEDRADHVAAMLDLAAPGDRAAESASDT